MRSVASSFNFQYPFFSLQSSSSSLRLLPRLPVVSIIPSTFPSIPWFRRQFLLKMCPIQLAFLFSLYIWHSSPPCPYVTLLHCSHIRCNRLGEVSVRHTLLKYSGTEESARNSNASDCCIWTTMHSPPASAEVKNEWSLFSTHLMPLWRR